MLQDVSKSLAHIQSGTWLSIFYLIADWKLVYMAWIFISKSKLQTLYFGYILMYLSTNPTSHLSLLKHLPNLVASTVCWPDKEALKNQAWFSNSGSSQEPGMVFQTKTGTGYYFIFKSQTWDWVLGYMGFRPQWRTEAKNWEGPVHRSVEHLYPHPLFELQSVFTASNIQCWLFCHPHPWCNKGMHGNGMKNIKWEII
jgi:hypothetical protein